MSSVTTFWSFKGGVGRSMLAANVAAMLTSRGRRVLLWDLDVEAPGLHLIPALAAKDPVPRGFLSWFAAPGDPAGLRARCQPTVHWPGLFVLPAFGADEGPGVGLTIDWWERLGPEGPATLDLLRRVIAELTEALRLDHVLIDARTGFTDLGGIVAGLLPDRTVLVGGYGAQQLHGWSSAWRALRAVPREPPLDVVLVASPVASFKDSGGDGRDEERRAAWREAFPGQLAIEIPWDGRLLWREDLLGVGEPESAVARAYRRVVQRVDGDRAPAFDGHAGDVVALLGRVGFHDFHAADARPGLVRVDCVQRSFPTDHAWTVWVADREVEAAEISGARSLVVAPGVRGLTDAVLTSVAELQRRVFDPEPHLMRVAAAFERGGAARAPAAEADGPDGVGDPVEALLQRSDDRVVIVGRGAAATLDRWAYALARRAQRDPEAPWPVRIDLRDRRSFGELLRDGLGADVEVAALLARQGRLVILSDGGDFARVRALIEFAPRSRVGAALEIAPPGWPAFTLRGGPEPARALGALVRDRAEALPWLSGELGRSVRLSEVFVAVGVADGAHRAMPIREAIAPEGVRLMLIGDPGAGKSTLLARLATDLLDEGAWLPVVLQARHALEHDDVVSAVVKVYGGFAREVAAARDGGRLVVLIDGVDEAPGARAKVGERLAAWVPSFGSCRVVLASRPHGKAFVAGFDEARVCPLEPVAQVRLLTALGIDEGAAEVALARLRQDGARLADLARNPLLLTLAATVLRADGALPRTRERLYERAITLRFERERVNPAAPRVASSRAALEGVVLRLHGQEEWTDGRVEKAARAEIGVDDPLGWAHEVARETGLIVKVEGGWAMPHRTLREHLVACALQRVGVSEAVLAAARKDEGRWAEVFALLAARLGGAAAELVERLRAAGGGPLLWKVLAEAEGLPADTLVAAFGLSGGRDAWEERMNALAGLPELVGGRLDLLVDVCERLGRVILHGAEAWQLREVVRRVADGLAGIVGPEGSVEAVRARARALVDTILLLHPARGPAVRDAARAEIVWCRVPAGRSWIGAHPDDPAPDDQKPGTWVQVVQDVEMGRDPVTNALYEWFDPEHAAEQGTSAKRPDAADHPVVFVCWFEAVAFAAWLSAPGVDWIGLPSDVAWEHACRAGTTTAYWSGDDEAALAAVGWYRGNSGDRTHAVGDLPSRRAGEHPLGLRHMHGNVLEWTSSFGLMFHPIKPEVQFNFTHWMALRGGSWWADRQTCRSAHRVRAVPTMRNGDVGFRLFRLPASVHGRGDLTLDR